jgi:hypothetical protein
VLFLRLAAYLLWLPGGFAMIAAVILPIVGSRLSHRGRAAAPWPQLSCADVRPGPRPVHVHGASAPGPPGLLHARLSGSGCVWYRQRLIRRYLVTRIQYTGDDWMEVDVLVEEEIWAWDSGPFALQDGSGSVLVAPLLLAHTVNAAGRPAVTVVDEIRDEGGEPWRYQGGALGALLKHGTLPPGLLDRFAGPAARTSGYRVQEDILQPGSPFYVFAVPGELGGEPIMAAPYQDVWAISVEHMPVTLARGGRSAWAMGAWFGAAGLAFFALSAVLLLAAG